MRNCLLVVLVLALDCASSLLLGGRTTPPLTAARPPFARAAVRAAEDGVVEGEARLLTAADKESVGNLVEDEEWLGLGMEMWIVLRSAMRESLKNNVRDFTDKDDVS